MPKPVISSSGKAPKTNVIGAVGSPEADAFGDALLNNPASLPTQFDLLFGLNKPSTVRQFVDLLDDSEKKALMGAYFYPIGSSGPGVVSSASELVEVLETSQPLKEALKKNAPAGTASWTPPSLQVNQNGLNLLLANPMVAAVVMEQRKKQSLLAQARVVAPPSGGLFGMPMLPSPSVSVLFRGGAMEHPELDNHPIEMRGAGYAVAHMRGGQFPLMLGTVGAPTQWRPVSDSSFISSSLRAAFESLQATLKNKNNATLEDGVRQNVTDLITKLEAAEQAVRDERAKLNSFNSAIATGSAQVDGLKDIKADAITRTVDSYNNAMKSRQKLENKLFRVIIALGGKVQQVA
jgi:hypothetical protein